MNFYLLIIKSMTDNEITFKKKISKSKIERNNELRIKEDSD